MFNDLQSAIRKEFGITSDFGLYEEVDGTRVDIGDEDDLKDLFEDDDDDSNQLKHIFVSVVSILYL